MENLIFAPLTIPELRQLFREELDSYFAGTPANKTQPEPQDEISGIEPAMNLTGLAKATIYSLTSKGEIPHSKKGKRLYFSKQELLAWIREGKRKTQSEIQLEAQKFLQRKGH